MALRDFFARLDRDKSMKGFQIAPGGIRGGLQRVKQSFQDPGQYAPQRAFANIVPATKIALPFLAQQAQKVLAPTAYRIAPIQINQQTAEDVGYGLRGAGQLNPFGYGGGAKTAQIKASYEPTTYRQRTAQDLGRNLYGTALTAPLGGPNMIRNIASRGIQGAALGIGINTAGTVLGQKRLPTLQETSKAGIEGLGTSWQLAFTNLATDKALTGLGLTKLVGNNVMAPFKNKQVGEGLFRVFTRALAEVPAENTFFTGIDKLSGKEQKKFVEAWVSNLPGNILGNLAFAGLQAGKGTLIDARYLRTAQDSLAKAWLDYKNMPPEIRDSGKIDFNTEVGIKGVDRNPNMARIGTPPEQTTSLKIRTEGIKPQHQTEVKISEQSLLIPSKTTLSDIETKIYGSATPEQSTLGGPKQGAGFVTDKVRGLQEKLSVAVGNMTQSRNKVVRNLGRTFEGFAGGLGKTQEQVEAKGRFAGGQEYAQKIANDVQTYTNKLLGNDPQVSERVWSVLDPELSGGKIKYGDLNADQKEAVDFLRQVSDFINDTNFKNGFISQELWAKNKGGKYIARAYEPFDFPPEVAEFIKQRKGAFDLNPFKQRTEIDDWKEANSIKDPAYLMAKRLQQTLFNDATAEMSKWMNTTDLVSSVEKPGFVKLTEHPSYGEMSGKWVRKDALEDIKGFFYEHDIAQKAYDLISWYDRNPARKGYKKLLTIFNPAVRLGNKTGNYVFAWFSGINPVTFNKNKGFATKEIDGNGELYRRMLKDGLVGTDITKADIANMAAELKRGVEDKNILQKIDDSLTTGYGKTDDIAKVSAMKSFLDRGITYEEAARRVYNGFQNYRTVGWLFDIGAKIPVLGNPFVRFKADFGRIMKNAVLEHPFRVASTVMAWKLFTDVMSRISGESEEDKQTREDRFASPRIPFTNTSLAVQTPWGEINAARLLGSSAINVGEGEMGKDVSDFSPIKNPLDPRSYSTDPLIGPLIATAMDKDFRGKSIKDPNQSKYAGSLLTPQEQMANQGKYLLRAYTPTVINSVVDITDSVQGKKDFYGRVRTPAQAALRLYPGVKVEQFGAAEAEAQRQKDADFEGYKREDVQKKVNAINKSLLKGEITETQATRRVQELVKENNSTDSRGKKIYEKSKDSPQNLVDTVKLYARGIISDPISTVEAMFTDERLRKIRGDQVIFERQTNLNPGGTGMEVDHTVSLGLGGDNSEKNLMYYPHEVKVGKDALEKKLIAQLENGDITGSEAQKQIQEWVNQNGVGIPYSTISAKYATTLARESGKSSSNTYQYLNENGDYKNITPKIDKVMSMPQELGSQKIKRDKEAWGLVDDVLKLSPEDQQKAFSDLGIDKKDADYYVIAKEDNDVKTQLVLEQIANMSKLSENRADLLNYLVEGRRKINGKLLVADGVVDDLYNMNLITEDEKKQLKDLDWDDTTQDFKAKVSGRGKGAKLKKISVAKVSTPAYRVSMTSGSELVNRVKSPVLSTSSNSIRLAEPTRLRLPKGFNA